jgi:hypothetical protein
MSSCFRFRWLLSVVGQYRRVFRKAALRICRTRRRQTRLRNGASEFSDVRMRRACNEGITTRPWVKPCSRELRLIRLTPWAKAMRVHRTLVSRAIFVCIEHHWFGAAPTALRKNLIVYLDYPGLPAWAHVWRTALRADARKRRRQQRRHRRRQSRSKAGTERTEGVIYITPTGFQIHDLICWIGWPTWAAIWWANAAGRKKLSILNSSERPSLQSTV